VELGFWGYLKIKNTDLKSQITGGASAFEADGN
jgi:hypothetical protein